MRVNEGEYYRHYKNGIYRILAVGTHILTYKTYITMKAEDEDNAVVISAKLFHQAVMINGKRVKRFVRLREGVEK